MDKNGGRRLNLQAPTPPYPRQADRGPRARLDPQNGPQRAKTPWSDAVNAPQIVYARKVAAICTVRHDARGEDPTDGGQCA